MKFLLRTALMGLLLGAMPANTQVLARPGWAGSGVAPEAWWLRAVFYRLDPARFQDSDGDGQGDLQGIVDRLDYLQSLGVDALLLDGSWKEPGDLGGLVREASRHQMRVLVNLRTHGAPGSDADLIRLAQAWLSEGVAGIWAPRTGGVQAPANAGYAELLSAVRQLLLSYPGERVLLTDPAPVFLYPPSPPVRVRHRSAAGSVAAARGGQLITTAVFQDAAASGGQAVRATLAIAGQDAGPGVNPLLRAEPGSPSGAPDALGDAALRLASRGAVMLNFGEEIGLRLFPKTVPAEEHTALPVMRWTPSNQTSAPVQRMSNPEGAGAPRPVTEFGAYHPYLPPPRGLSGPPSSSIRVTADANIPPALPSPDSLPGFSAAMLPVAPVAEQQRNVTTEDRDPQSLLNAYRQLIALHHGSPTVRNGTQRLLDAEAEGTLVWVRRAPAGSRTAANVIAAVNFTSQTVILDVDRGLEGDGMRGGALRPLFASSPAAQTGENTSHLVLPPHGVLIGEIRHAGALRGGALEATRGRRSGRRGRRVRR